MLAREAATAQATSSTRAMPSLPELQRAVRRSRARPRRRARATRASPSTATRCARTIATRSAPRTASCASSSATPFFDAAVDAFVDRASVDRRRPQRVRRRVRAISRDVSACRAIAVPAGRRAARVGDRRGASRGRRRRLAERTLAALAAIPGDDVARQRFALDPSCRLLRSPFPVLRIWQVHQDGDGRVRRSNSAAGDDYLLVRREGGRGRRSSGWRPATSRGSRRSPAGADLAAGARRRVRGRRDVRSRHRAAHVHRQRHADGTSSPA